MQIAQKSFVILFRYTKRGIEVEILHLTLQMEFLLIDKFVRLCYYFYNRYLWALAYKYEIETEMNL